MPKWSSTRGHAARHGTGSRWSGLRRPGLGTVSMKPARPAAAARSYSWMSAPPNSTPGWTTRAMTAPLQAGSSSWSLNAWRVDSSVWAASAGLVMASSPSPTLAPPGGGTFGADDVGRGRRALPAQVLGNPLCDGGEPGGAFGRSGRIVERRRLSGTAHRGVEVQLAEAGRDVGLDHSLGAARSQRRFRRTVAPTGFWAEMVAAEERICRPGIPPPRPAARPAPRSRPGSCRYSRRGG